MSHIDTLARTLYGEAEAQDLDDARAIAAVILNRVAYPNWPDTISEVCLQPWQFSCWNTNDPNRQRIMNAQRGDDDWIDACYQVAADAIEGRLVDPTFRSTHYYLRGIKRPRWAKGKDPVYRTARGSATHLFFNDIDTPPPQTPREALDQQRPLSSTRTVRGAQVAGGVAAAAGVASQVADAIQPFQGLLQTLAAYAPWVLAAILAAGCLWMLWARIDDRNAGLR